MIKTVKWFNELWVSPDHNLRGFKEELKPSASRLRNSHWENKLILLGTNPSVSISFRKRTCKWKLPQNETSLLNRSCTYCKAVRRCFLKKHIIWTISVTAGKFVPKTSNHGRVVKALDLRSNGLVSSWVRTPVVAFSSLVIQGSVPGFEPQW